MDVTCHSCFKKSKKLYIVPCIIQTWVYHEYIFYTHIQYSSLGKFHNELCVLKCLYLLIYRLTYIGIFLNVIRLLHDMIYLFSYLAAVTYQNVTTNIFRYSIIVLISESMRQTFFSAKVLITRPFTER